MAAGILLIGGSNIDYLASSEKPLIKYDSNPGKVTIAFGGVGRNICENLVRMGDKVSFITGLGNDELGKKLGEELIGLGVSLYYPPSQTVSSSYLAICGPDGNMEVAICDARASENINEEYITSLNLIMDFEYPLIDANLAQKTIEDLVLKYPDKKWCLEAVSACKVIRAKRVLSHLYLWKGNLLEAQALSGYKTDSTSEDNVRYLLSQGVENVVITQGAESVVFGCGGSVGYIPVPLMDKKDIVNATGAGDAAFAGIIHMLNRGENLITAIRFGIKASQMALKSQKAVNPDIGTLLKA